MAAIAQPGATEYAPYYETYVRLVRGPEILKTLEKQAAAVRRVLSPVPEGRAGFRHANGKWTIREDEPRARVFRPDPWNHHREPLRCLAARPTLSARSKARRCCARAIPGGCTADSSTPLIHRSRPLR